MNTLKIADNQFCFLHRHNLHQHVDKTFPYFEFEDMRFGKDRIKGISETKMDKIESKTKEVMAARKNILDAEKRKNSS